MKKTCLALFMLIASAVPAHAELSAEAKANEKIGRSYAVLPEDKRMLYAIGMSTGMQAILKITEDKTDLPLTPPDPKAIFMLLDWCYCERNCLHVSPGAVGLSGWSAPEKAKMFLLMTENAAISAVEQ